MLRAPLPPNEAQRLEALRLYRILDTDAEQAFDELTRLASEICGTPISLMSFVDEGRQWFKARVGLDTTATSRDIAFCAHAILQKDLFIVPDTHVDPRFADNPLVVAYPKIRFYAGAPLINPEGFALGTLCVIDRAPRELSPLQAQALRTLRQAAVTQLELRRKLAELATVAAQRDKLLAELCAECAKKAAAITASSSRGSDLGA